MTRTAVQITKEQYEAALKDAEKLDPQDPKAREMVDKARDAYIGAVANERLEKGSQDATSSL